MNHRKPTDVLRKEHEKVLQKMDDLERMVRCLDDKNAISGKLSELASFFNTDFRLHFAKEEEALFPVIESFLPRQGGPTGVMLIEHEDLRATNDRIQDAVKAYLGGPDSSKAKDNVQEHVSHFIGLLKEHIYKEDNILFSMADMHLDGAQGERIIRLFEEIEARVR